MLPSLGGGQFSLGSKLQNLRIMISSRGYVGCCTFDDDEDDGIKFGEDLGCCPVWEEEAGSMRPPAAALANAGPRPHTLLVSHFVELCETRIQNKNMGKSVYVLVHCAIMRKTFCEEQNKLDLVGSTVRYEMMKLYTGSV